MRQEELRQIAEILDQLIRVDISGRGVIDVLYGAARQAAGQPLTAAAADLLRSRIKPGATAVLTTGWVDQPMVAPDCGESDGPPGTVALARALRLALKAAPVIVTDECLVPGMKKVARAAGFQCVQPEELRHSIERDKLMTIAILPFPAGREAARREAAELISRLQPGACIAVERGGMNAAGIIHNMGGDDTGDCQAKLDYLFQAAHAAGVATIGIGDGGNEIGMGNIAAAVRQGILFGDKCRCACGQGLAAATTVDVLITAVISNWGAYALAALLGAASGLPAAINDAARERRVLMATADAGFHDPLSGAVEPGADGCGPDIHMAMVTLLRQAALRGDGC